MDLRDGGRSSGGMFALYLSHYPGNRKYYVPLYISFVKHHFITYFHIYNGNLYIFVYIIISAKL